MQTKQAQQSIPATIIQPSFRKNLLPVMLLASMTLGIYNAASGVTFIDESGFSGPRMQAGKISSVDQNWQTINFRNSFSQAPVIVTLNGEANASPATTQIRNVTPFSFEISQQEANNAAAGGAANDGITTPQDLSFFAIEPGIHNFAGATWEVGRTTTATQQHGTGVSGTEGFDTINFTAGFGAAPAFVQHLQSFNNGITSLATAVDSGSLSSTSVDIALQRAQDPTGGANILAETIGYIAVTDNHTGSIGPVDFESLTTADAITGQDSAGHTETFQTAFVDNPLTMGSLIRMDGSDGGWLRQRLLTPSQITLFTQEDQAQDTELTHTTEAASILAFSEEFFVGVIPEPSSLALLGLGLCGWMRRRRSISRR